MWLIKRNFFIMYRSYIPIFIARLLIHAPFTLDICPKIGEQEHVLYIKCVPRVSFSIYGDSMGLAPYLHLPQGALSSRAVVTNVSQSVTCQISKYCYHGVTLKVSSRSSLFDFHWNIDSWKRIPMLIFFINMIVYCNYHNSVTSNYKCIKKL